MKSSVRIFTAIFCFVTSTSYAAEAPRKAIVVGASHGIGAALAIEMAHRGYRVGICSRNLERLAEVGHQIGDHTCIRQLDVTDLAAVPRVLEDMTAEMGGVDVMVISSGIWPEIGAAAAAPAGIPFAPEKETIDVNVTGFTAVANYAMNKFIAQGRGHVVGISSVDAVRGGAGCPAYCASKSFVATYLEGMRNKCIQQHMPIDVTEIRPGFVATYDIQPGAYWVATPEEVAVQINDAIEARKKIAYVTKRWAIIAALLKIVPDWLYNKMGGF